MKYITFTISFFVASITMQAQLFNHSEKNNRIVTNNNHLKLNNFLHGVASGDPTQNSVILWTRISGQDGEISVSYKVATDTDLTDVIAEGTTTTSGERDYTVKLDLQNLSPSTTYYYQFQFEDELSQIGRTKTASANSDHIRFGVVSCSNFQAGYFNAYQLLSQRADLDAVIHLGDYIYEYGEGGYGWDSLLMRGHDPKIEILTLIDYRTRYSFYRMDVDLQALHQQNPMIVVWDDHEAANDSYKDGAQNHTPDIEGDWEARKAAAKQAWFEWLPVRDEASQKIYRSINYGDLLNLTMVDTRLEGRERQIYDLTDTSLYSATRTIMGQEQLNWFKNQISTSNAQWQIIGNQVIFAQVSVGTLGTLDERAKTLFNDTWNGYPAERDTIINFIESNNIDNVVILTGDFHTSFAMDIAINPFDSLLYNPATGLGATCVEFAVPSITSPNFDENAAQLVPVIEGLFPGFNPHLKLMNLVDHGYCVLDVTTQAAQVDFFYTDTLFTPSNTEIYGSSLITQSGNNYWQPATQPSAEKANQPSLAPGDLVSVNQPGYSNIIGLYPNPAQNYTLLNINLQKAAATTINIINIDGRQVKNVFNANLTPGFYSHSIDVRNLPNGIYFMQVIAAGEVMQSQFTVSR